MSYMPANAAGSPRQRSLGEALAAGSGVAVLGAIVWGLIIYLLKRDFSIIAVGLGLAVGTTIARMRPGDTVAAIGSAVISLLGAMLGAILAGVFILLSNGVPIASAIAHIGLVVSVVFKTEGFLGYMFWVIAAFFGFRIPMQVTRGRARTAALPAAAQAPAPYGMAAGTIAPGAMAPGAMAPGEMAPGEMAPGGAEPTTTTPAAHGAGGVSPSPAPFMSAEDGSNEPPAF